MYVSVAILISVLTFGDSMIFWYAQSTNKTFFDRFANFSFAVYGVSLLISLAFLIVGICRISSLLKQYTGLRLNERQIVLHACFLAVNVALNLSLLAIFIFGLLDQEATVIFSVFYFVAQPLSLVMMLYVIVRISNRAPEE